MSAELRLYNCCTNHAAPDWSTFSWLEIGGCTSEKDEDGNEWVNGGVDDAEAEFWTVYGRLNDGGCDAITDCMTRADVHAVAAELSKLSGLEIK